MAVITLNFSQMHAADVGGSLCLPNPVQIVKRR